jgi:hypothetical protein
MAQSEEVMRYRARAKELDQDAARYSSAELRDLASKLADIYERLADRLEALGNLDSDEERPSPRGLNVFRVDNEAAASVWGTQVACH